MTGIEIFANLVAAYEGTPAEKSNKVFGSLVIIMGTTAVTIDYQRNARPHTTV